MNIETTRTFGITATAIILLISGIAAAQESPNGILQSIAIDEFEPNIVYTAGAGRIYRSNDHGSSWSGVEDGIFAWSIAVGPFDGLVGGLEQQIVYIATMGRGVMRSTNGFDWNETAGLSGEVRSVTPHPDGTTVFAGADAGVYKSHDRGANWQLVGGQLGPGTTQAIVVDPLNHNAVYASRWGQGVYRSIDGGLSWLLGNSGLFDTQLFDLAIHPLNSSVLFAATPSGVFQSVDAGASWVQLNSPKRVSEIVIDPTDANRMFVTTEGNRIGRSVDGGQTWTMLSNGLQEVSQFVSIAVSPDIPARVYAGTVNQGLFYSDDHGDTWQFSGEGEVPNMPPPISPPLAPTILTATIVDRNGAKVELGERANFDVIVRNTGREIAQDTIIRIFWQQVEYPNDYRGAQVSWPSGSCSANEECHIGDVLPNTELRLSVSAGTSSEWVGPFRLSLDGYATNSNEFLATTDVVVTRTILTVEDSSGGGAIDLILLILGILLLMMRGALPTRNLR